ILAMREEAAEMNATALRVDGKQQQQRAHPGDQAGGEQLRGEFDQGAPATSRVQLTAILSRSKVENIPQGNRREPRTGSAQVAVLHVVMAITRASPRSP